MRCGCLGFMCLTLGLLELFNVRGINEVRIEYIWLAEAYGFGISIFEADFLLVNYIDRFFSGLFCYSFLLFGSVL